MIPIALMLAPIDAPDAAPAMAALRACDREAVRRLTQAEPRRRTDFAAAAYAEQRGIAAERAALTPAPVSPSLPLAATGSAAAPAATPANPAIAAVEARQKQLDDAQAVEKGWRELIDTLRADFLVNCAGGRVAQDR